MSSSTKLFNNISKIYGKFFNFQIGYYEKIIDSVTPEFDITKYDTVLDVGCGTGALSNLLHDKGLKVTGIDTSEGMLDQALKRSNGKEISFRRTIPGERLPFADKSFDIVISSYVAHGLNPTDRIELYHEMKRVSKKYVILHDYNSTRGIVTTIVEWFENGDYFNFIKVVEDELDSIFKEVKVVHVDTRAAWYICHAE